MQRRFALSAAGAAAISVASIMSDAFQGGGVTISVAVQDLGEAAAALVATIACGFAARRSTGQVRRAWALIGLSALSWGLGETVWSIYEVGFGMDVPFPSFADVGFLTAIPLAVAGILQFPFSPTQLFAKMRVVLDGLIVASALTFAAWSMGLDDLNPSGSIGVLSRVLAIVYPAADILLITVLVVAMRKATPATRILIALLVTAFVSILVADGSFSYLVLRGQYGVLGSLSDSGWVIGYLLIAMAAVWSEPVAVTQAEDEAIDLWRLALPWFGVLMVIVGAISSGISGLPTNLGRNVLGSTFGILFFASQAIALNDTMKLLRRSREGEAKVREQSTLVTQVFNRAPIGILRVGTDIRVIDVNPAALAMVRAPVNKHSLATDYLTAEEMQRLAVLMRPLWQGETDNVEAEQAGRRADGSEMWIHWGVTAIRKPDGEIDYFLVLMDDVTIKHQNDVAMRNNTANLERLNRLKSEFMSMVSHEFRTALTGIQGYSEIMASQDVTPDEVKEFSSDINADALRLNRMITEMLDLDRIESGRIQMHLDSTDVNSVLVEAVNRARMQTTKHQITLGLDANTPRVEADRDRLTEVVTNLLSNAIKYSPNGGEIVVTTQAKGDVVEVSVKDHGQGIPPDFINRIFSRYERYEAAGKTQVVGTGLGLAIAKQIVQLHQGDMWVESKLGEGSEFHFTIPVRAAKSQDRVA